MTCSLRHSRRHRTRWFWALLGFVLLLAACSDDGDSDASGTAFDRPETDVASTADDAGDDSGGSDFADDTTDQPADSLDSADSADSDGDDSSAAFLTAQEGEDEESPDEEGSGLAVPTDLTSLVTGRQIIYTATIDIKVDDVGDATIAAANAIVVECRCGLVFGQDTTTDPVPRTVLTFKVFPADFDEAMTALAGIGHVESQTISTDDVTERVVDLESRITTAAASVERVRLLLEGARDLNVIRDLEGQLLDRETLLEQLRGRLKTIRDQVSLATITLTIVERSVSDLDAGIEVVAWLGADESDACPGSSELAIEADDNAVLCIEVRNTADDVLTEIDIAVPTFRLRVDDLDLTVGSTDSLEPGDALTAVVILEAEDGFVRRQDVSSGINIEITTSAVPAGDREGLVAAQDSVFLSADVDEPLPGFGDSFDAGWGALTAVIGILLIIVGASLPFVPFIAVFVWLTVRSYRRGAARSYVHDDVPVE